MPTVVNGAVRDERRGERVEIRNLQLRQVEHRRVAVLHDRVDAVEIRFEAARHGAVGGHQQPRSVRRCVFRARPATAIQNRRHWSESICRMGVHRPVRQTFRDDTEFFARRVRAAARNVRGDIRDIGRGQVLLRVGVGRRLRTGAAEEEEPRHEHHPSDVDNVPERSAEIDIRIVEGMYNFYVWRGRLMNVVHFLSLAGSEVRHQPAQQQVLLHRVCIYSSFCISTVRSLRCSCCALGPPTTIC